MGNQLTAEQAFDQWNHNADFKLVYGGPGGFENWSYTASGCKDVIHEWRGDKCFVALNFEKGEVAEAIPKEEQDKSFNKIMNDALTDVVSMAKISDMRDLLEALLNRIQHHLEVERKRHHIRYKVEFNPQVFLLAQRGTYGMERWCYTIGNYFKISYERGQCHYWRRVDGRDTAIVIAFH